MGNLNEIIDNSEKLGGRIREEVSFFPFHSRISDCHLRMIPSKGCRFSCAGERSNAWVQCCIERPLLVKFTNDNLSRSGRFILTSPE